MHRFLLIFLIACSFSLNAQNPAKFDSIYSNAYLVIAQNDFDRALSIADSLFVTSETPYYQTKSLMLSASLYQQSGDLKKSIEFAVKSKNIIQKTDNYDWISRVYGFLATQYRLSGLYQNSKKHADTAFEYAKKLEGESRYSTQAMLLQEMAFREIGEKNYEQAIRYLKSSRNHFEKIKENKAYLIAQNEQLLGDCYLKIKDFDQSLIHYKTGRKAYGNLPDNFVKGLIFDGLATIYLNKNENQTAKIYLDSAKSIAESSNYLELKKRVLDTSQEFYLTIKDIENVSKTKIKQDSISQEIDHKKITLIDGLFDEIGNENSTIKKEVNFKNRVILFSLGLLVFAFGYFLFYRKKQQHTIRRIKKIIEELENKKSIQIQNKPIEIQHIKEEEIKEEDKLKSESSSEPSILMTSETEEKLIQKLEQFESSTLFTQNSISLSALAIYCETNTKYLSYIINTYKKQDFYNYINELRINYIIMQLNQNPLYRKYKIATLAEESGFSSQNKFATVFKKVTGISPSTFIKYLEEEKIGLNN